MAFKREPPLLRSSFPFPLRESTTCSVSWSPLCCSSFSIFFARAECVARGPDEYLHLGTILSSTGAGGGRRGAGGVPGPKSLEPFGAHPMELFLRPVRHRLKWAAGTHLVPRDQKMVCHCGNSCRGNYQTMNFLFYNLAGRKIPIFFSYFHRKPR